MLTRFVHAWFRHRLKRRLPTISLHETFRFSDGFNAPSPTVLASIVNGAGVKVGYVRYGESPISDRTYVFDLHIGAAFQRQFYGFAVLDWLAFRFNHAITPIQAIITGREFWIAARRLRRCGIFVTEPISTGDMDNESKRWSLPT